MRSVIINHTALFSKNHSIVLDFPLKDSIFIEDYSSVKAESCFLEKVDTLKCQELFAPKLLTDWKLFSSDSSTELKNLSLDNNFLFKGNNLIVLHSILAVFRGAVKLIYIDPPYNTGNSFVYKDKLSRATWLLFMKNRVEIAREFLQHDGILVVQCDENEQAYLKILLDEIYGEENFIGMISVVMNPSGRDYRYLARTHEYLLIYGKSSESILYPLTLNKKFPFYDDLGAFELRSLRNGNIRFHQGNRPNLYYPFYVDINNPDEYGHFPLSLIPKKGLVPVYPKESQGINTVWRWGKEKSQLNITQETKTSNLVARASKDSYLIFEKYRKDTRLARTVWTEKEFQTSKGTLHIKEMFQKSVFDYPKPELLIARIIDITTQKGDRVMDFFLGSGTTAAVAHKSQRTWIGVEQMDYIDTVTIPRLQKVLTGEQGGASTHYQWSGGGEFIFAALEPIEDGCFPFYKNYNEKNKWSTQFYHNQ